MTSPLASTCPTCGHLREQGCAVECSEAMPPRNAKAYRAWAEERRAIQERHESPPVRLSDLTQPEREVILALINAQREACSRGQHVIVGGRCKYASAHKPGPLPIPGKGPGAAHSEEKGI